MSSGSPEALARTAGGDVLYLTVVGPAGERRQVRVDRSPFRIGRLPDRELTLKDSRVSRNHAQILLEDDEYYVEDCESRHGVFVNGRKTARTRLKPRDRIEFGIDDSYQLLVGKDQPGPGTPLLEKVAKMQSGEGTGNLSRLSAVIDVARALESSGSVDDVLSAAVDAALSITGADRGFLMLKNPAGELRIRVARDDMGSALSDEDLRVPRQVLAEALDHRSDLFAMSFDPNVDAAQADAGQTVVALELRSVVCVPLVRIRLGDQAETSMLSTAKDTLGLLYMDSRQIARNLAEGNQEVLQTLGIEISTVLENARLLEEERKKHSMEQELQIAREIQQGLLPPSLPSVGWLTAAGSSEACFQVGGDYFDVMPLDADHWGAVLVDVSGKGVSAALLTSLLQGAFFSAAGATVSLSAVVERVNRYVCERSRHARFATAFYAILDRDGGLRWVNAGHCAGLLAREDGKLERLEPTSTPIGLFEDADFPETRHTLLAGDRLVLFSDGVSEAANFQNERFEEERLEKALIERRSLGADDLHRALLAEISDFTQGAEQADDLTLLVLGYDG